MPSSNRTKLFYLLAIAVAIIAAADLLFNTQYSANAGEFVSQIFEDPDTGQLPYFIFRTLLRMLAAYILVAAFGLSFGIVAGLYEGPRRVMLPILDILQSIPILGYLPAAILFFVYVFPGVLGQELASILLIFTSMAWSVTFSVYGGVRAIPSDIKESAKSFGVTGWRYIRDIVLPSVFPSFVTGSMLAMGGGWYFLAASEYLTFGSKVITLEGIGYYLAHAVYVLHNIPAAIFGLCVFAAVVYSINRFIWRPLIYYSKRFTFQSVGFERDPKEERAALIRSMQTLSFIKNKVEVRLEKIERSARPFENAIAKNLPAMPRFERPVETSFFARIGRHRKAVNFFIYAALFVAVMLFSAAFFSAAIQKPVRDLQQSIAEHPEVNQLPLYALYSLGRIAIAYVIALVWTLAAAILIMRSKKLQDFFIPIFDVAQSIPAIALLPFIVVTVLHFVGGGLGIEFVAIILILTGSQWYLLFNIIGAIRSIPADLTEASSAFGIRDLKYVRQVLLPAIFPGIILGSIQAWGGAWNALIVSEYIIYEQCPGGVCSVNGLGSFLNVATAQWADSGIVVLTVALMSLVVIVVNNLVWKRLFTMAEKYRFEST
ncbi:TPA: ABC transporter permease subunit [Candidatus Micrarchaeota archaeon]|nr:ABC transporter permease subunit [Candidatus Micrarchaeota archaeon]